MSNYALTKVSSNSKTGKIPVTVSNRATCPPSCPLLKNGCYAEGYYTQLHWDKVTNGERGTNWNEFINSIKSLPKRILWRHNVSGDLVGSNDIIDAQALAQLVQANKNKSGFTYTHYTMTNNNNIQAVKKANDGGFTVNLSANNIEQADQYKSLNIAPVVVVVPEDCDKVTFTPNNHKIVVCPAQTSDKVTCSSCGLCQKTNRDYIIGFRVHGTYTKKAKLSLSI
tara:strand:+ start:147 stop:821 length:675 start_codon:yes stop_codon:yes gene_type:complete